MCHMFGFRSVLLIPLCVLSSPALAQTPLKRSIERSEGKPSSFDLARLPEYKVILASDCDHVMLRKDEETLKVGLLGVEAPPVAPNQSSKAVKKATAAFMKHLFSDVTVRVQFGTGTNRARAYLYRSSDAKLLNQEVIEEGYGVSSKKLKHRLGDDFDRCEKLAKSEKRGLWNPEAASEDAEPTPPEPKPNRKSGTTAAAAIKITWLQYIKECGLDAQRTNEARTETVFKNSYKGRSVHWSGVVYSVQKSLLGKGFMVNIRMSPTESALGTFDLTLSGGQDLEEEVTVLAAAKH